MDNLSEALKRLEIRLPVHHWIFNVEPGERAALIRQALDLAALVNRRFDTIEELLRRGGDRAINTREPVEPPEAPKSTGFVTDILSSIQNVFD